MYIGMTECNGAFDQTSQCKELNSIGFIRPNVKAKIIDAITGKALGSNTIGELCLKKSVIMNGYYKNPEATREAIDSEGKDISWKKCLM